MVEKNAYLDATPAQAATAEKLLRNILSVLRAQYFSYQTSHWQVKGSSFYGNHLLFQRLYESVQEQVDQLAEKMVGYFGTEAVSLVPQMKSVYVYCARWSQVDCNHKRGILSEEDLQFAVKSAYDGIKAVGAMTLGLDDWLMATANAHEENTYLLQQALAPIPGEKQASIPQVLSVKPTKPGSYIYLVDIKDHGLVQVVANPNGSVSSQGRHPHAIARAAIKAVKRYQKDGRSASGAPTAEGDFYDSPDKKNVLEFAQSGAISNSVEVTEKAYEEDQMSTPEPVAIADAEKAPPLPVEVAQEPGGAELSTLNRYVLQSEDPKVDSAIKINERERMARLLREYDA